MATHASIIPAPVVQTDATDGAPVDTLVALYATESDKSRDSLMAAGHLPPAALPNLQTAFSRRRALFGVVAVVAAPAVAIPAATVALSEAVADLAPLSPDTVFVAMQRHAMDLKALADNPDTDADVSDAAYTRSSDIQRIAIDATVTTAGGALASLLWGREEFARYYVDEAETPDWLDRFTLKMIDNAIAVLRAEVGHG